jgi:tRNA(Ile)-lysidine synthase
MTIVNKVRAAILAHHLFPKGETVIVGVSGGPDSLALLDILHDLASDFAIQLHVAHLNHRLRGDESDADAAFVADLARGMRVPATIEMRPVAEYAREHHLSSEEAARIVRYRFLAEVAVRVGSQTVAVGHNADDQVETVLMHFLRGAGLAGLRGMIYKSQLPYVQLSLSLVRPLLDATRAEIETYCGEHDLNPRFDQSNLDTAIFRNRLRHEVIPYLERINPKLREVLHHGTWAIADDYEYLQAQTQSTFSQVAKSVDGAPGPAHLAVWVFDREKWRALPTGLQRATLREAVRRLRHGLRNINWVHIEAARRVASEKGVGAEATLPQGLVLIVGYDEFTIGETVPLPEMPLLHGEAIKLRPGATVEFPESEWMVRVEQEPPLNPLPMAGEDEWTARLDADQIHGELSLRTRRPGERFEPSGMSGRHKSVHEFMIDDKVPRHIRDLVPILTDDEKILWVCGYRTDERAKVTAQTRRVLRVEFSKSFG